MNVESTSQIAHDCSLSCSVEHAFATYTSRIGALASVQPPWANRRVQRAPASPCEARKKFGDWPVMLDRFVALAS